MGLNEEALAFIDDCMVKTLGSLPGKRMLELGNQEIFGDTILERTGKRYYANRGVEHTSVDLNGLDGAIKLDLAKPDQFTEWRSYFDIVTNSGTSEHVEPKSAQYECFTIVHNCLAVGGIAVHMVPDKNKLIEKGSWKNHCNNYYSADFFRMLVSGNKYKLIATGTIGDILAVCVQKTSDSPFMRRRDLFLEHIYRQEGGVVYQGINDACLPVQPAVEKGRRRATQPAIFASLKRLLSRKG